MAQLVFGWQKKHRKEKLSCSIKTLWRLITLRITFGSITFPMPRPNSVTVCPELADEKFDLIVSNIPAKVGNEMLYLFLYDALHHLKPNGKFVVVTVNGLRHFCKRTFNEIFGNYKKEKQGKAYTISSAQKQE